MLSIAILVFDSYRLIIFCLALDYVWKYYPTWKIFIFFSPKKSKIYLIFNLLKLKKYKKGISCNW